MSVVRLVTAMVASVVAAAVMLAWAPSAASAAPAGEEAWLRGQLVGSADLVGFGVTADKAVPVTDIIGGSGAFFDDVRRGSIRASYRRALDSFDGRRTVVIRVTEYVNHAFAGVLATKLSPTAPPGAQLHASDAVGKITPGRNGQVTGAISETRGRVVAELLVRVGDQDNPGSTQEALALARKAADAQYDRMLDSVDLVARTTISLQRERWTFLVQILWFLLVIQVLAAGLGFLRDRSTRERLLRRVLRGRTPGLAPGVRVVDATASARRLRWRHRGGVLLRNAGLVALIVATYGLPTRWEFGVILGLGMAASMAELVVARVSRRSGLRAAYGTGALVARVLTSTVTFGLIWCAAQLMIVTLVGSSMVPAHVTAAQARSAVLLFLSLGLLAVGLADLVSRVGRRLALRSAARILTRDTRPEILFLRSFMDDQLMVRAHRTGRQSVLDRLTLRRFDQFEDILAWALWRYGPMVAFGDHWLPPLGAARVSVPKGVDWQAMVWSRLASSQLILMSAGRTRAVVDEITMIRQAGALAKTIFVFPPVAESELKLRLRFVTQALELRRDILQPAYRPGRRLLALTFDPWGNPVCVLGDGRDDLSYQAALAETVAAVRALPPASVHSPVTPMRVAPGPPQDWLQPIVMPAKARRKVARRRFWAIAPWAGTAVLQLASQILALPPIQPPVPVPGHILSRAATNGVAAVDGRLLFTDGDHKSLVTVDPSGHATSVLTLTVTPIQVFTGDGALYVTTVRKPGVVAVSHGPQGYATVWTAPLPAVPASVARAGNRVFASLPTLDTIAVLDATSGAAVGSVRSVRGPFALAEDGTEVVAASVTDSTLTWIDVGTLTTSQTLRVDNPSAILRSGGDLLIGSTEESSLTMIDLATRTVRAHTGDIAINDAVAMTGSRVLAATYDEHPRVVILDRGLRQITSIAVPTQVENITLVGTTVIWNLGEQPALTEVALPGG